MIAKQKKTTDGHRLIWWGKQADRAYWHSHFFQHIVSTNESASREQKSGFLPILTRHLPKEGRILEAGCGTGWVVSYFLQRGYRIEGVDFSGTLVQQVLEQYPELPIQSGDVCKLAVPDGYYQGYISLGVIEHRREGPEPFLREAYRVVAPGGTLCISVPHFNSLRKLKHRLGAYEAESNGLPFYQYGFTKKCFRHVLEANGLEVERFEFYGTNRCLQEELQGLHRTLFSRRGLWRLPKYLDRLDPLGIAAHMIMAIAHKP